MRKVSRAQEQNGLDFRTAEAWGHDENGQPNKVRMLPDDLQEDIPSFVNKTRDSGRCQYCGRGDCGGGCESEKRYHDEDNHWGNKHTNVQSDW